MKEIKLKVRSGRFYTRKAELLKIIQEVLSHYETMTVRQIYYRLIDRGAPTDYTSVMEIVRDARYYGLIGWNKITDETRGIYKTESWENIDAAVNTTIDGFRFDRWKDSPYYLEVWVEKRGMIRQLFPITDELDVLLVPCGGCEATSGIWEAAKRLHGKTEKKITILYLGDLDPTGDFMDADILNRIREFGLKFDLDRILVNADDVDRYGLERRFDVKGKKPVTGEEYDRLSADPRSGAFLAKHGDLFQVELDAVEPGELQRRLREEIEKYLPEDWDDILQREEEERQRMRNQNPGGDNTRGDADG